MTIRPVQAFEKLFTGYLFPTFMIAVLVFATVFMSVMLVIPVTETPFGAFVEDFKTWCFSYDPDAGTMNWAYVAVMILNPIMLIGIVAGIWWHPIRETFKQSPGLIYATTVTAVAFVSALGLGLLAMGPTEVPDQERPFPAERLRLNMDAPAFSLWNQEGQPISLESLKGKVVIITAIYATCTDTCPMILTTMRKTLAKLSDEEREKITVVAITLDPENDTPEKLKKNAEAHQLYAPQVNLVNGDSQKVVNDLLDQFNFARWKNPENNKIEHANMFILIDANQKIAYRLNLGERHQNWLDTALKVLLAEV